MHVERERAQVRLERALVVVELLLEQACGRHPVTDRRLAVRRLRAKHVHIGERALQAGFGRELLGGGFRLRVAREHERRQAFPRALRIGKSRLRELCGRQTASLWASALVSRSTSRSSTVSSSLHLRARVRCGRSRRNGSGAVGSAADQARSAAIAWSTS